ncbi:MAG: signal peptidase I [Clostridia bacterium]|nr:signal peptidase I [Clostridia bacterium]
MVLNKTFNKIWNITTTVIVAIVVVVAIVLMGLRLIGFQAYTVLSGSMEPNYSAGDLIYVKSINPNKIKVGDAITFVMNEELTVATHRVIKIDSQNQHFYTKGDANDTPDANPVHFNNLIGKPKFAISGLGYVSNWIQNPPGTYIAITVGLLLILAVFLPDFLKNKEPEEQSAANTQEIAQEKAELEKIRAEIVAAKAELEEAKNKTE